MGYYDYKPSQSTNKSAYYLGTLAHGQTISIAGRYANYANLTAANFVIVPLSGSASNTQSNNTWIDEGGWTEFINDTNTATYNAPSISYNPANGQLSFSSTVSCGGNASNYGPGWGGNYVSPSATVGLTAKVYLLPDIENI